MTCRRREKDARLNMLDVDVIRKAKAGDTMAFELIVAEHATGS